MRLPVRSLRKSHSTCPTGRHSGSRLTSARASIINSRLDQQDAKDLIMMASILEKMLSDVHEAFSKRNLEKTLLVLRADAELDRIRDRAMNEAGSAENLLQRCRLGFDGKIGDEDPLRIRKRPCDLVKARQRYSRVP